MNDATRQRLSDINRAFYSAVAEEFDRSRAQPWAGWQPLLPHLAALPPEPRVLDVGCGNGRFGHFLAQHLGNTRYTGVDNCPEMTQIFRERLPHAQLLTIDLINEAPPAGPFDLVVCFGLLHHIPGAWQRQELIRALAASVAAGGLLTFVTWRFADFARFRQRIVPWPAALADQVEPGDHLLDWRRGAYALRYCHHFDNADHETLLRASGLPELANWYADGPEKAANRFSLLQRPQRA